MSQYSFIATDYELPEVDNSKEKIITVSEAIELGIKPHVLMPWEKMNPDGKVMIFEKEEDLGELVIRKVDVVYDENISWYTTKPFIYSVDFGYTEGRAKELLDYLKKNMIEGYSLELWNIWLDDKKNIKPKYKNYNGISLSDISEVYDSNNENYANHSCIIIEK